MPRTGQVVQRRSESCDTPILSDGCNTVTTKTTYVGVMKQALHKRGQLRTLR
jgi:hypothetical protein